MSPKSLLLLSTFVLIATGLFTGTALGEGVTRPLSPLQQKRCDAARGLFRDSSPEACRPTAYEPVVPSTINEMLRLNGKALQTGRGGVQLLGDWESSGDLPLSYVPEYAYAYECQVEVSDRILRVIDGVPARIFAVAQLRLNNQTNYVKASELQWSTIVASEDDSKKSLVVQAPLPFETTGVAIWLNFSPDLSASTVFGAPSNDVVALGAQAALQFGDQLVAKSSTGSFSRSTTSLVVTAEIFSHNDSYSAGRARRVYVQCVKQK